MRFVLASVAVLLAHGALAQSQVETVPLAPPPAVSVIESAQSLGTSPNDLEVDEVNLAAVPALSARVTGDTRRVQELIARRLAEMAAQMREAGLSPAAPAMAVFDQLANSGFRVELMVPVAKAPAAAPAGLTLTTTPRGRAVRIIHRGDYDDIDATYEELSSFVEDRDIEVEDIVIERYMGDVAAGPSAGTIEIIAIRRRN